MIGGAFWEGFKTGLIVAGLNHISHFAVRKAVPSFDKLKNNYPRYEDISDQELFELLGGDLKDVLDKGAKYACALRISYTLNESGDLIPDLKIPTTFKSGESPKRNYIINTKLMNKYLSKTYNLTSTSTNIADYVGKQGIIFFRINYNDAYGHITLWDGSQVLGVTTMLIITLMQQQKFIFINLNKVK